MHASTRRARRISRAATFTMTRNPQWRKGASLDVSTFIPAGAPTCSLKILWKGFYRSSPQAPLLQKRRGTDKAVLSGSSPGFSQIDVGTHFSWLKGSQRCNISLDFAVFSRISIARSLGSLYRNYVCMFPLWAPPLGGPVTGTFTGPK